MSRSERTRKTFSAILLVLGLIFLIPILFEYESLASEPTYFGELPPTFGYSFFFVIPGIMILLGALFMLLPESVIEAMRDMGHQHVENVSNECPACGRDNSKNAKFCQECATPLTAAASWYPS